MKNIFILCISLSVAISTNAQTISRLQSQAGYDYSTSAGYTPADSANYIYGYSRGSNMKTGLYLYDTSMFYQNNGSGLESALRTLNTYESPQSQRIQSATTQMLVSGNWENVQRVTMHYPMSFGDTNAVKKDTILTEHWNKFTNTFLPAQRLTYTYNNNKDVTLELEQIFDNLSNAWVNSRQTTNTYTGNRLVLHLVQDWDDASSAWVNAERTGYTYASNNLVKDSTQVWDATLSTWQNRLRNQYSYNASGNNTVKTHSFWDQSSADWILERKDEYEYDPANRMISDTLSSWDNNVMAWAQNWLYTYDFDNAGNLLFEDTYSSGPDSFLRYRRQAWTYNMYDQPLQFAALEWDFVSASWMPMNGPKVLRNYHYELFNTSVADRQHTLAQFTVYPVPAQNYFLLKNIDIASGTATVSLFNIQGQQVKTWYPAVQQLNNQPYFIDDLPSGLYLLHIAANNKEMTKPLIIDRR